jgi:hypothetical protein
MLYVISSNDLTICQICRRNAPTPSRPGCHNQTDHYQKLRGVPTGQRQRMGRVSSNAARQELSLRPALESSFCCVEDLS